MKPMTLPFVIAPLPPSLLASPNFFKPATVIIGNFPCSVG